MNEMNRPIQYLMKSFEKCDFQKHLTVQPIKIDGVIVSLCFFTMRALC